MPVKYLLSLLLLLLISLAGLGSVPLFDVDEAVFAQATKEMVLRGDWISPTYNDTPRYDKPIFFYWFMAVSYAFFGINEFGARFPSALSGIVLAMIIFLFVRRVVDEDRAFSAAIAFAASIFYFAYSHAAVTDMTLTLFITLALCSFFIWSEGKDRDRYLYGLYFFSALAFLTKGLVGILFPFGIAVIYQCLSSGMAGAFRVLSVPGIFLFVAVAAPWYVAQYVVNGDEFIEQFFVKHHFRRYTGVISGHKGPLYYYLPVLFVGAFPWSAYVIPGIRDAIVQWRGRSRMPGTNLAIFCLVWGVSVVLFFSLSTTKLPNYILPSLPAFAVLAALGISGGGRWTNASHGVVVFAACALVAACLIGRTYLPGLGIINAGWVYWCAAAFAGVGLAGLYGIYRRRTVNHVQAVLMVVLFGIVSVWGLPEVHNHLQGSLYRYSLMAGKGTSENDTILVYRINNPSILYYSGRRIANPYDRGSLEKAAGEIRGPLLAITKSKDTADLKALGFTILNDDGRYALLERK